MRKRFQAFTLLEMIISLIIAGIIAFMTVLIFFRVQASWNAFYLSQDKLNSTLLFKRVFDEEFRKARIVGFNDVDQIEFIYAVDTVTYKLSNSIVRQQKGIADTFLISVQNLGVQYVDGLPQNRVVRRFKFDIIEPIKIEGVEFHKLYTSRDLITLLK